MRRVGVLLAGCGAYDGSDVQESVLLVLSLSRPGMDAAFLAPDVEHRDVVDHSTGDSLEAAPARRVLTEAARIARGVVSPIHEMPAALLDALVIPGGIGTVKNLCLPGTGPLGLGAVRPEVASLLEALLARKAPIAVLGLAHAVLARHQGLPLGQEPVWVGARDVVVNEDLRTVFTPGFMGTGNLEDVAAGIDRVVENLARWLGVRPALRMKK